MPNEASDRIHDEIRRMNEGKERVSKMAEAYAAAYNAARAYEDDAVARMNDIAKYLKMYFSFATMSVAATTTVTGARRLGDTWYVIDDESKRVFAHFKIGLTVARSDIGLSRYDKNDHDIVGVDTSQSIAIWKEKDDWFAGVDEQRFYLLGPNSMKDLADHLRDVFTERVQRLAEVTPQK